MLISGALGAIGGATKAIYKGNPILRSAMFTGTSCCLVGTACFGCESLAYFVVQRVKQDTRAEVAHGQDLLVSHGVGGCCGGAIVGGIFQGRTFPGMLMFTPLMLGVAFAEIKFLEMRAERVKELQLENLIDTKSQHRKTISR